MRICLYSETALPKLGGQELVVDALARNLGELGHDVTVLAARPRKRWQVDDSQLPYRVVRHWPLFSTHRFVGWYRHSLTRLYRSWPFDVLHCHSVYPCGYLAALAGDTLPSPVVVTSHGGDVREGNARLSKHGMGSRFDQAIRRADALVAISRFTADGFRRLGANERQIVSISNGVELAALGKTVERPQLLDNAIEPDHYVLFLGRLHRRKGVDVLLDALAQVPARGGVELVIAGDGDERAALEAQAVRMNVATRVRFVGRVAGAEKAYLVQHARALALPSRDWEAFPLVVLEAFAAGTPVIGTRIPGLGDLIEPGETGWLVEPESADSLANALKQTIYGNVTARMQANVRHVAEQHAWPLVAERYVKLYQRLVDERRVRKVA